MPECGACGQLILDDEGNERPAYSIAHTCKGCGKPLHSIAVDAPGCSPWMPADGAYFCSRSCIKEKNAATMRDYCAEAGEDEELTPGCEQWGDFLDANEWYELRMRPTLPADDSESESGSQRRSERGSERGHFDEPPEDLVNPH